MLGVLRVPHDHLHGGPAEHPARELIEAAMSDGATPWQVFRYVTLPLLGPTVRVTVFLSGRIRAATDDHHPAHVLPAYPGRDRGVGGPGRMQHLRRVFWRIMLPMARLCSRS
jgi:hypothetical protein